MNDRPCHPCFALAGCGGACSRLVSTDGVTVDVRPTDAGGSSDASHEPFAADTSTDAPRGGAVTFVHAKEHDGGLTTATSVELQQPSLPLTSEIIGALFHAAM